MSDRILAGIVFYGRNVVQIDDENAIVHCDGCCHSDPYRRPDELPLDTYDLNQLLLTPCPWCGGRKTA